MRRAATLTTGVLGDGGKGLTPRATGRRVRRRGSGLRTATGGAGVRRRVAHRDGRQAAHDGRRAVAALRKANHAWVHGRAAIIQGPELGRGAHTAPRGRAIAASRSTVATESVVARAALRTACVSRRRGTRQDGATTRATPRAEIIGSRGVETGCHCDVGACGRAAYARDVSGSGAGWPSAVDASRRCAHRAGESCQELRHRREKEVARRRAKQTESWSQTWGEKATE